jgi:hypothetical protein
MALALAIFPLASLLLSAAAAPPALAQTCEYLPALPACFLARMFSLLPVRSDRYCHAIACFACSPFAAPARPESSIIFPNGFYVSAASGTKPALKILNMSNQTQPQFGIWADE